MHSAKADAGYFPHPQRKAVGDIHTKLSVGIDRLADKLTIYSTQVSKKHKAIGLYQDVLYLVESLLTFIETHFTKYFNLDAKIPESYYRVEQNEIKKKVEVATILLNKLNINEQLTEMFLVPLITFINEKKEYIYHISQAHLFKRIVESGKNIHWQRFNKRRHSRINKPVAIPQFQRRAVLRLLYK